jgi:site-specific DNA-methyltransferase (adenine-specific)
MQWLVRLICPHDGIVLDMFGGSGTTALAALAEGKRFILIEEHLPYVEIARARIAHAQKGAIHAE